MTVTATVLPLTAIQKLDWTSDNGNIKIEPTGDPCTVKVTGVNAGNAKLYASATDGSGKKASCSFSIGKPVPDFTIAGKGNADTLKAGKTLAMAVNWGGNTPKNTGLVWEIRTPGGNDASDIASIDPKTGKLTGIAEGTVRVRATSISDPAKYAETDASSDITVYVPVKNAALNTTSGVISLDDEANGLDLDVNITSAVDGLDPTGVKTGESPKISWSTDSEYLTVDSDGVVRTADGAVPKNNIPVKATVTAFGGYKKVLTCKVSIKNASPLKGVKLSKTSLSIGKGNLASLTAKLDPVNPDGPAGMWWSVTGDS